MGEAELFRIETSRIYLLLKNFGAPKELSQSRR
jgi:hypothetical protein